MKNWLGITSCKTRLAILQNKKAASVQVGYRNELKEKEKRGGSKFCANGGPLLISRPRAADFNNEMGRVVNQCGSQNPGSVGKVVLHRISRGVALTCLVLLVILPIALLAVHFVHPKTDSIRIALFWSWMFLSPLLAGMGLLLAMLAMVIVNSRYRKLAALLAFLTTAFLLFMSQMI